MKIYSDRRYLPPGTPTVVLLYPFWGAEDEEPGEPTNGRFAAYLQAGPGLFQLTDLTDATCALFPAPWERSSESQEGVAAAEQLAASAAAAGKKMVVFYCSDSDAQVRVGGAELVVLRTSFFRSRRMPNEFALPGWSEDFMQRYLDGHPRLRDKADQPVVGFCGLAEPLDQPLSRRLRGLARVLKRGSLADASPPGAGLRTQALRALKGNAALAANFEVRDRFWGGAAAASPQTRQSLRNEYVANMVESDYMLCMRGAGNFSYRLYETLSCGRIPVFVDTDCVLPYDFAIDWRQYCVWVDATEIDVIGDRVREFHDRLSPGEFHDLQRSCRRLWEEWISPQGFFAHFELHLSEAAAPPASPAIG